MTFNKGARWTVISLIGVVVILVAWWSTHVPPPKPWGQLIEVGGHKLHIRCEGEGSPAVILESGAGEFSVDWALTMPRIAQTTRVCAWDRAGYAWSDPTPEVDQFPAVASDMKDLLFSAGVQPPWLLVGHGMGALYVRDYQRRYPEQVVGLVLVDPTPEEDFQVQMSGNTVALIDMADHDLAEFPVRPFAPSRTSPPPRPSSSGEISPPFDKLPADLQTARAWALRRFFKQLDALDARQALAIMESERATFIDLYNARHNPETSPLSLPIVVISRGQQSSPEIKQMQDELAHLSRDIVHITADDSGTFIHLEKPGLVAAEVTKLAKALRR
jgi:pimeloyl-ACP methyl ester carboxylesterase